MKKYSSELKNKLRNQRFFGLVIVGLFLLSSKFLFSFYTAEEKEAPPNVIFLDQNANQQNLVFAEFNPNELDEKQWLNLGFTEKQVATILKYKQIVGGNFKSKEQLKKCYAISEEKFRQISSFVLLPETTKEYQSGNFNFKQYEKKSLKIPAKFNPDQYSASDFQIMGFSENQANAILKYKKYLGGSFVSKEKFKECFIISDENYQKIAPHLLLPEKTPENYKPQYAQNFNKEKPSIKYHAFDPNLLDLEGWKSLGFTENQSASILKYKNNYLKGSFKTYDDIENCFMIKHRFQEMKPFIQLNPDNFVTIKPTYTKTELPNNLKNENMVVAKTDFSSIDLNSISFKQMQEFGFTEKDAAMMLSFRKKLGGFVTKQQFLDTYEIDKDLAAKLTSTAKLDASKITKYTLVDAPEDWLKSHPYFKYSADRIIFFRMSNPDEKKIWKFIKVKPEYEAKMRLYLK